MPGKAEDVVGVDVFIAAVLAKRVIRVARGNVAAGVSQRYRAVESVGDLGQLMPVVVAVDLLRHRGVGASVNDGLAGSVTHGVAGRTRRCSW